MESTAEEVCGHVVVDALSTKGTCSGAKACSIMEKKPFNFNRMEGVGQCGCGVVKYMCWGRRKLCKMSGAVSCYGHSHAQPSHVDA